MKRLFDLDPAEVSLVGKAANKKKFLIYKSRKGNVMPEIDLITPEKMKKIDKVLKSMPAAMPLKKDAGDMPPRKDSAVFKDKEEGADGGAPAVSERGQAAMKAAARILAPHKDELHKGHLEAVAHEIGMTDGPAEKEGSQMAIPENVEDEHHVAALGEAQKAYSAHLEKMGYRKYPDQQPTQKKKPLEEDDKDDESGEDDVSKTAVAKSDTGLDLSAFPENQRAALELIFKSNSDLVKKNAELEKDLKHERDTRVMKDFQEKAKSFRHLGANTEELGTVLKSLSEKDPEAYGKMEAVLKAADAQIGMGADLFTERGTRISKSASGSPDAKLDALVDSVVQKSDGNKTREMIYDEVLKSPEGQRLYAEMKASRPHGI